MVRGPPLACAVRLSFAAADLLDRILEAAPIALERQLAHALDEESLCLIADARTREARIREGLLQEVGQGLGLCLPLLLALVRSLQVSATGACRSKGPAISVDRVIVPGRSESHRSDVTG